MMKKGQKIVARPVFNMPEVVMDDSDDILKNAPASEVSELVFIKTCQRLRDALNASPKRAMEMLGFTPNFKV